MITLTITLFGSVTVQQIDWCSFHDAIRSLDPFQAAPRPEPKDIRTLLNEAAN